MAATKTLGTILEITTDGIEAVIHNLTQFAEVTVESEDIDTTDLESPGYKEFIPGLKEVKEIAIKGIIKSIENQQTLWDLVEAQTLVDWLVTYPDGEQLSFTAYLKAHGMGEAVADSKMTFQGSLKVSGPVTYIAPEPSV